MPCSAEIIKGQDQAYHDMLGFWWCHEHQDHGLVIDYGVKHNFPRVEFVSDDGIRYAIGNNKHDGDLWKMVVLLGNSKMIRAAASALHVEQEQGRTA
jgi:hypothetical protein